MAVTKAMTQNNAMSCVDAEGGFPGRRAPTETETGREWIVTLWGSGCDVDATVFSF